MTRPKAKSKKKGGVVDFKVTSVPYHHSLVYLYTCLTLFITFKVFWMLIAVFCFSKFQKRKVKIGRRLPPPKNSTNTEVKSKGINFISFLPEFICLGFVFDQLFNLFICWNSLYLLLGCICFICILQFKNVHKFVKLKISLSIIFLYPTHEKGKHIHTI